MINSALHNIQVTADFGVMVLIWIVQLCIYPSFKYFPYPNLQQWHQKYTRNITIIVMPLMLTQLSLTLFAFYNHQTLLSSLGLLLLITAWFLTFGKAVPLHVKLDQGEEDYQSICRDLVSVNGWRAWIWTGVFLCSTMSLI